MRARLASAAPPALIFLAGSVLLAWHSLRVHTFLPDEYIYITQARQVVRRFPDALWDQQLFYLGFERIHEVLQAAAIATLPPAEAFMAGRIIPAVAFASVAIPVWLLARGIGLGRAGAAVAAAASVAVPWVALATTFLNEPVAYPAVSWAVWGIWRSAVRGGVGNDALALALIAVAGLSRSSMVVVGGALPVAVLAQELRFGHGAGARDRLRAAALAIWRRHRLLVVALGAVLVWLVFLGGVDRATGYYATSLLPPLEQFRLKYQLLGLMLAEGLLVVTAVFALAWMLRTLARGDDPRAHAFVVAAVATALLITYSAAAVAAVQEDRYLFYVVPLVLLCAVAGVVRRELPVALVAAVGAAVALLIVVSAEFVELGPYDHIASAGRTWWRRVVLGRIHDTVPAGLADHADVIAAVLFLALAVGLAYGLRRGGRVERVTTVGVLAGILVVGVLSAAYAMDRYVTEAGDPEGSGFRERTVLDRTLGRDAFYKYLDGSGQPTQPHLWRDLAFWNESFQHSYLGYANIAPAVDRGTGRISEADPTLLTPEIVTLPQYREVALAASLIAESGPVQIFRLERPYQARWLELGGVAPAGGLTEGRRARFRVFGAGLEEGTLHCLWFQVASSEGTHLSARAAGERTDVDLPAGGTVRLLPVPLPGLVEEGNRDVVLSADPPEPDVVILRMAVRPCPGG